ncbi:hypothetical protein HD597_003413 [Nonomuraea thailandensis]|uniref:Uncharacterized protein n=1 Tax=Nonomuraea thailandensis TaxID=1188745 RepID=A0A9X2K0Z4_9ACTN|nr:hypothetical protein [Nonomuraea thailandensis]MCP2356393.1 hypothetical protein [Nonomuraea thailandensis]
MSEVITRSAGWGRALLAGVVGAVLPLVLVGAFRLLAESGAGAFICPTGGLECVLPLGLVAGAGSAGLGWVALLLVRVRPAWLVTLAGIGLTFVLGWSTRLLVPDPAWWLTSLLAGACFAVAALCTRGVSRGRVVVAVVLLGAYPVAAAATPGQQELDRRDALAELGIPLVVADLPGYRLGPVSLYSGPGLTYHLVPDGSADPATPYQARRPGDIEVMVTSVPARFTPPADCSNFSYPEPPPQPCEPIGAQAWRRTLGGEASYVARDGRVLISVRLDASDSAQTLFRQVVASGRPRSAGELAGRVP